MVDLSDEAAGLIRTLVANSDLPDSAGLRLAPTTTSTHSPWGWKQHRMLTTS